VPHQGNRIPGFAMGDAIAATFADERIAATPAEYGLDLCPPKR
jgi:hypothetical protein